MPGTTKVLSSNLTKTYLFFILDFVFPSWFLFCSRPKLFRPIFHRLNGLILTRFKVKTSLTFPSRVVGMFFFFLFFLRRYQGSKSSLVVFESLAVLILYLLYR